MKFFTRMCMSLDGYVATPDGRPAQLADPNFDPQAYGFAELHERLDGVLMGRTTFEPALAADRWPRGELRVFVLGSRRPAGTPEHVVVEDDPRKLVEQIKASRNNGRDVHLVGGPRTIETFRSLGALDELGLIVMPFLLGGGIQLTPALDTDAGLSLKREHPLREWRRRARLLRDAGLSAEGGANPGSVACPVETGHIPRPRWVRVGVVDH